MNKYKLNLRIFNILQTHRYELISLLTGASVMILEIVGTRLIAPYFGTSTYVWTSMIGVILGSLSLGLWYGGRLADKYDTRHDLGLIIAGSAVLVLAMSFLQEPVLTLIANQQFDLRFSSIIAAIVLFGAPSMLIGMVSPHLAKLRVTSLKTTGATIGRLEAASAIGSIGGTFLSGYWLLAYFGTRSVTLWLVILLAVTSFLASPKRFVWSRVSIIVIAGVFLVSPSYTPGILADIDSAYNRYQVVQSDYNSRTANLLIMDRQSVQSGVYPDSPSEIVFPYAKSMIRATLDLPDAKRILVIGGGAYTIPMILGKELPQAFIDVAEIDPVLDKLSREYFGYTDLPNLHVYHEDGRTFINRRNEKYDLILIDAFNSLTPPFHLTSREAVGRLKQNLQKGGAVIVNTPTEYDGEFLPSLQKTYANIFGQVSIHQAEEVSLDIKHVKQNFIIVATESASRLQKLTKHLNKPISPPRSGILLTDNYAPVERLSF